MRLLENVRRRPWWQQVLGLVLVPALVASGLLAATWGSDSRLHQVEAAIVNLDQPVTINNQYVPLGRQFSAALIDSHRRQNFRWVLANEKSAQEGLAAARYAAVVTVPKNFSAAATSYGTSPTAAHQATIEVQTSPQAGIADTALGQSVAQAAAQALNRTLTQTYLENIYLGFSTMGEKFQTVADAASQLAAGNRQLADGLLQAQGGSAQLADGLGAAAGSGPALRQGGQQLVAGIQTYTDGVAQAAAGSQQLAGGLAQLSANAPALTSGAQQLAGGAQQLAGGVAQFRDQGLAPYTRGTTQLATENQRQLALLIELRVLMDKIAATPLGSQPPQQLVNQLQTAITTLQHQLASTQASTQQLSQQVAALPQTINRQLDQTAATLAAQCPPQVRQLGPDTCRGYAAGVMAMGRAAKQTVAQILTTPDPRTGLTLQQALQRLSKALAAVSDPQLAQILQQVNVVLQMASQMLAQGGRLPTVNQLRAQNAQLEQLKTAGPQLMAATAQLGGGAQRLSSGASGYAAGVGRYTGAVGQAAQGAQQLSNGLGTAAAAGPRLVAGGRQYTDGVGRLVDGVGQAATGAKALNDGLSRSHDGASQLADGSQQLADGLAEGARQVPRYSDTEREQLARVVASPISVSDLDDLVSPKAAWASLLLVLALWLGALATYLVLPAVRARLALSSRSSLVLLGESLLPGLGLVGFQALLLSGIGQLALRLPWPRWLGLTAVLLVAAAAFVAVHYALTAWLRGAGRVLAVAFAVITVATALTGSTPAVFDVLRPLSPMSPAVDAVRTLIAGGSGITGPIFLLLGWAAVAAGLCAAALVRARTLTPRSLLAAT